MMDGKRLCHNSPLSVAQDYCLERVDFLEGSQGRGSESSRMVERAGHWTLEQHRLHDSRVSQSSCVCSWFIFMSYVQTKLIHGRHKISPKI